VITAAAPEEYTETSAELKDIDLLPFISDKGRVMPNMLPRAAATVFIVFDENEESQYIGFSKDIRNTLRQMLIRQPDQCYYFRTWDIQNLDQKRMLAARQEWIKEVGRLPPGNGKANADAWATAPNLKLKASATKLANETIQKLRDRGLTESFEADVDQLKKGIFTIQESTMMTNRELDEDDARRADAAINTFAVTIPIGEQKFDFTIYFSQAFPTNGGYMFDCAVVHEDRETIHRVIVGREWEESTGKEAKEVVQIAFAFLLSKNVPRHIEGLMESDQFPVNYFSMSEVEQWFPDFADFFGKVPENYWRFDKRGDYGQRAAKDDPTEGHPLLGPGADEKTIQTRFGKVAL